jgi:hypothetical protein
VTGLTTKPPAIGNDDATKGVESMASKVLKVKLWDGDLPSPSRSREQGHAREQGDSRACPFIVWLSVIQSWSDHVRGLGTSIDWAASISAFDVFFRFRFLLLDLIPLIVADSTSSGPRYSSTIQLSNTRVIGNGFFGPEKQKVMGHGKGLVECSKSGGVEQC